MREVCGNYMATRRWYSYCCVLLAIKCGLRRHALLLYVCLCITTVRRCVDLRTTPGFDIMATHPSKVPGHSIPLCTTGSNHIDPAHAMEGRVSSQSINSTGTQKYQGALSPSAPLFIQVKMGKFAAQPPAGAPSPVSAPGPVSRAKVS